MNNIEIKTVFDIQSIKEDNYNLEINKISGYEILNDIAFGEVIILINPNQRFLRIDGRIFNFYYELYDSALSLKEADSPVTLYDIDQSYQVNVRLNNQYLEIQNMGKSIEVDRQEFMEVLKSTILAFFSDIEYLYPLIVENVDYNQIKNEMSTATAHS